MPKWYFTSPDAPHSSYSCWFTPTPCSNSWKICARGLRKTLPNTFRRPRCAIPMTTFSTPSSEERSINALIPGMKDSQPSRPNLHNQPKTAFRTHSHASTEAESVNYTFHTEQGIILSQLQSRSPQKRVWRGCFLDVEGELAFSLKEERRERVAKSG